MIIKPIGTLQPLGGFAELSKGRNERDDKKVKEWAKRINDNVKAQEAYNLWQKNRNAGDTASTTLPELMTEAFLIRNGIRYTAQAEMGTQRPDFVLHNVNESGDAIILRVQGDYWHADAGKDEAKSRNLVGRTFAQQSISTVIDLRESDIYHSEHALEQAIRGEVVGNAAVSYEGWSV